MMTLDRDLLFGIADKLVFGRTNLINSLDLIDGVKFMMVNRACKRAFMSQFTLNISFLLHGGDYFGDTRSSCLMDETSCYINIEKDKWLVALLIQNERFKPISLAINGIFNDYSGFLHHEKVNQPVGLSALECFSNLLGLEEALDLSNYKGPELRLLYFKVNDTGNCLMELDKLLALNPVSMDIDASTYYTETYSTLPDIDRFSPVNANRVEIFKIIHNCFCYEHSGQETPEFSATKWLQLLSYVMSSCVNLKKLHVWVKVNEQKSDGDAYYKLDSLLQAIKQMRDIVLPPLLREGCFIQVELVSRLTFENIEDARDHNEELFSIGVAKSLENNRKVWHEVKFDGSAEMSFSIADYSSAHSDEEIG